MKNENIPESLLKHYPASKIFSPKKQNKKITNKDFILEKKPKNIKLAFKENQIILN